MRRFLGRFDLGVALLEQRADDFFRVVGVHLAAEGFDVEGLFHLFLYCNGLVFGVLRYGAFRSARGMVCRSVLLPF